MSARIESDTDQLYRCRANDVCTRVCVCERERVRELNWDKRRAWYQIDFAKSYTGIIISSWSKRTGTGRD